MNKLNYILKTAILGIAISLPLPNLCTKTPSFTINNRNDQHIAAITIHSIYDFDQPLSLKVNRNPKLLADDVLIKKVEQFNMHDAHGIVVRAGFAVDKHHDLVIGFSGGTSEIIQSRLTPDGLNLVASFKDNNGLFVAPSISQLAVSDLSGKPLCFDYRKADTTPLYFALLLDRSHSMYGYLDDVKQTAKAFLKMLPSHAQCAVAQFGNDWSFSHQTYQNCGSTDFEIDQITIKGFTDIYPLLKTTYSNFKQPVFSNSQKAIIIISDGFTIGDQARKRELIAMKNDVLTLTYFIGNSTSRSALEGISDHFVSDQGDVRSSLTSYFSELGLAYNTQKVLNITSCEN